MRGRRTRVISLLVVAVAVAVAARGAWVDAPAVSGVRAAMRDYLAYRRVEKYRDVLLAASEESGVDPDLLGAVMIAESGGRPGARSHRGALGLFQLRPITAEWRAEELGLPAPTEEQLLEDPLLNARLGADYLAWLLRTYDGDLVRALVAYNLGPGSLAKLVGEAGGWDAWRRGREGTGDSALLAYAARVIDYRDHLRKEGLFEPRAPEGKAAN